MRQSGVTYRHFTDEEIKKANSVDLLMLAKQYGYETEKGGKNAIHLKKSGGLYIFPNENCFYHHTSDERHKEGGAIRFVMHQENLSFGEAVAKLLNEDYIIHQAEQKPYTPEPRQPMLLPEKADNFKRAYWYLVSVRGVEPQIVSALMNEKKIYQESKFGNVVFVGYDRDGTAKYCSMRSTYPNNKFKRDADNSDKSYPFFVEGKSDTAIITEAPIELISHATLTKMFSKTDWKQDHRVSLGCLSMAALDRYLEWHPEIKKLVFALNNDYLARNQKGELANWGQMAADKAIRTYTERGYQCALHKPQLNDFNIVLTEIRKGKTFADLDIQREAELKADFEKNAVQGVDEETEDDLEI